MVRTQGGYVTPQQKLELIKKIFSVRIIRFIIAGGLNTGFTYALYLLLMLIFPYWLAFSVQFICGIFFSYYIQSKFVFRVDFNIKRIIRFPAVYITQYIISMSLLSFFVEIVKINKLIAPLIVVAIVFPITFLLSRYVLTKKYS